MLQVAWRHGISELHDLIPHLVSLSAKGACEVTFDIVKYRSFCAEMDLVTYVCCMIFFLG